jgi:hypothetical protein
MQYAPHFSYAARKQIASEGIAQKKHPEATTSSVPHEEIFYFYFRLEVVSIQANVEHAKGL